MNKLPILNKMKHAIILVFLMAQTACTNWGQPRTIPVVQANLTVVSGPLARKGVTTIPANFTWNGSGAGTVTVYMPDGEILSGRYSTVADGYNSVGGGTSRTYVDIYESDRQATGYGRTNYQGASSTLSNRQNGRAIVTGSKGTVLNISYVTSQLAPTSGYGSAYDNKGNRYSFVY